MSVPKQFNFAASSVGEPWWWLGELTKRILADSGYTVDVRSDASSYRNPRWVGNGDALIGGAQSETVLAAQNREGPYKDDDFPEFQGIARVDRPCWFAAAATAGSRITSLEQIKTERIPARFLTPLWTAVGSEICRTILGYYGLTPEDIEEFGGKFHHVQSHAAPFVREGDVDVLMGNIYMGNTPGTRYWNEASILSNLRFLVLPEDLRNKLADETYGRLGVMPKNLVKGVEDDYPTIRRGDLVVYCRPDLDEDFVYQLARSYDENGHWFFDHTAVHMGLHPSTSWNTPIPLHPGAERYYRERGYIKGTAHG